jgi:hypothetical protein
MRDSRIRQGLFHRVSTEIVRNGGDAAGRRPKQRAENRVFAPAR